jgi:hypothetical protein
MVHRRNWSLGFRFGSKADIQRRLSDVRFVPILLQKSVAGFFGQ